MASLPVKGTVAQAIVDQFAHHNMHSKLLLELYPDLRITLTGTNVEYGSTIINSEVDQFQFEKDHTTTYLEIYAVYPYKNVRINCTSCEGIIRVNPTPHRIPLVAEHCLTYNKEFVWYGLIYEETLKLNNFNQSALAAVQLHLIEELGKKNNSAANSKVDITYLNNSLRKLLPFA